MKTITTTYIEWLKTKVDEDSTTGDLAKDTDFSKIKHRLHLVEVTRSKSGVVKRALDESYIQFQQETDPIVQITKMEGVSGLTKSGRVIRLFFSDYLREYVPELNSFH